MTEPIPDPAAPDDPPPPAPATGARPDWLVGAEDGVTAELDRKPTAHPTPALKLSRPIADPETPRAFDPNRRSRAEESPLELAADPAGDRGPAGAESLRLRTQPAAPAAPEKKKAWTQAASSVPTLRLVKSDAPAPPPAASAKPAAGDEDQMHEFPADAMDALDATVIVPPPAAAGAAPGPSRPAPPRVAPPREAWWVVALDELRSNRRVQILAGLVLVAAITLFVFLPRAEMGTSVGDILRHGDQYDGRHVKVVGRVGEVFEVGGGYAFYLHQGRDTLVVFTRSRVPHERDHIAVEGQISTGFLDGQARQALFEAP